MNNLVRLLLPAGVATSPLFMEDMRRALSLRMEEAGLEVRSELLFPYGDRTRKVVPQLREATWDARLHPDKVGASIGGRSVLEAAEAEGSMARTVFVGHSGGGVAAVHAAQLLLKRHGGSPSPVVLVGSPKCRIPESLRDSVLYLFAAKPSPKAGEAVRVADPICRLGSFGGWSLSRYRLPLWRADSHPPATIRGVRIVGGHADYFRVRTPYVNELGLTNLDVVADAAWTWLRDRI